MAKSPVRRAFLILGIVAVVVALALVLAQDQETLKIQSAVAAGDAGAPDYVATLIGADVTRGDRYEVLTNGDQIFPALLAAMDGARRRISFETYIYDTGEIANRFTDALERAARRGVAVQVIVDAVGAGSMEESHVERLTNAGAKVYTFNPTRWYNLEDVNYRTHRKILVVDGAVGFTGGVGVADHWLGNAQDKDHWRDTQIRIEGPIVQRLEGSFYENFIEASGPVAPILDGQSPADGRPSASFQVRSSPTGGSNDLKRLYLLLIASARRTLDITSPYFVVDESTTWAFEDAVRRGVEVRILVEGDETDAMPVKYASRQAYERLLELGIEIHEYQPTMMHTKVLVVDGVVSMFGSANFDNRSLELNDELNVVVFDPDLAARFLQDLAVDLGRAKQLDLETWRDRSLLQKTRETFWSWFSEIF